VAEELDIQKHVLRFWESKFNQLKPMKRGGGRRYYRPEDVELLRGIHHLLRSQAYTIKGVQRILREQGIDFVKGVWLAGTATVKTGGAAASPAKRGRAAVVTPVAIPAGRTPPKGKRATPAASEPLSAEAAKTLKSVVDQLETVRQSLAKTRKTAAVSASPKAAAPTVAKAKASSRRT
jgi:DNA-binding transcriptional MerR regulator